MNKPERIEARYYGAAARSLDEARSSSSGGIASVLSRQILSEGGIVFGAAWDPFPYLKHIEVADEEALARLKGSKYVESDIKEALKLVKARLEEGRRVLFVGLPCQIAAVYGFLGGDHPNLITIDLICHGKPPAKLFAHWAKELEKKLGSPIVAYSFRNKQNCEWNAPETHLNFYCLADGRTEFVPAKKNWYSRYFLGSASFYEGCYRCPFAKVPRVADITLGDFWGGEKEERLQKFVKNGLSLVSVQSEKGARLIEATQSAAEYIEVQGEFALRANAQLTHACKRPIYRNFLFKFVYLPPFIRNLCDRVLFGSGAFIRRLLWK